MDRDDDRTMRRGRPLLLAALLVAASLVLQGCLAVNGAMVARAVIDDGCRATGRSAGEPELERGLTILPLSGAHEAATELAEDLRADFDLPVHVGDEQRASNSSCHPETGQLRVEPVLEQFAQVDGDDHAVIVLTVDDIRSDQAAWQFGAWDPDSSVAVLSAARLRQHAPPGANVDEVRRGRVAALGRKYALMLWFQARPGADTAPGSLLAPLLSFTLLDAADDDVCRYRTIVGRRIEQFRPCAPEQAPRRAAPAAPGEVTVVAQVWREAIAHGCQATRERLRSMEGGSAPPDFIRTARAEAIRQAAVEISMHEPDPADSAAARDIEAALTTLADGVEGGSHERPLVAKVNARTRGIGVGTCL